MKKAPVCPTLICRLSQSCLQDAHVYGHEERPMVGLRTNQIDQNSISRYEVLDATLKAAVVNFRAFFIGFDEATVRVTL